MTADQDYASPRLLFLIGRIVREHKLRGVGTVLLLAAAGLAEGVGLITLLPLVSLAGGEAQGDGPSRIVRAVLNSVGLEPSIGLLLTLLVFGLFLKGILSFAAFRQAGYLGADLSADLRLRLIKALVNARWTYFTRQRPGSITNSISIEAGRVPELVASGSFVLAYSIQVLVYLTLAALTSLQITLLALMFGALLLVSMRTFVKIARGAGREQASLLASLTGGLADVLRSAKALKSMALETRLYRFLEEQIDQIRHFERRQMFSRAILPSFQEPLMALALAPIAYILLQRPDASLARLLFLALLFQRVVSRIGTAQGFYQTVMSLEGSISNLDHALGAAEAMPERAAGSKEPNLSNAIELNSVRFSYDSTDVLRDLSIRFPAGKMTTLAGPSGVGKTTILDLVIGLIQAEDGEVLIDDIPLRDLDMHQWRSGIGYVPQDTTLLHDSVAKNVSLGDPDISEQEIREALDKAGASEFIRALPEGIESTVGEQGLQLSGGQRQRLSIARAVVRHPRLLILDEATTALDPLTEKQICNTIANLKGEMTILAVSHQPAIMEVADHVVEITRPAAGAAHAREQTQEASSSG